MMQENVELVRSIYDAGRRRDTAAVLAAHDPEVEWDISRAPARSLIAGAHVYVGHDGLRTFFREWYEAWEIVEADEDAAVWEIRGAKVIRVTWFGTRAEAFQSAGMRE